MTLPPSTPIEGEEPPKDPASGSFFKELPVLILIAFGLALIIKTFLVQAFYIPSESMVPTLEVKDRVLVNKLVYRFREPKRGEIIVFVGEESDKEERSFWQKVRSFLTDGLGVTMPEEKDFIKRVIALPGERITVRDGRVTITPAEGKRFRLNEPYLAEEVDDETFGPFTVPDDSYFVMGDNRANSADSRTRLGPIPKDRIVGRAFVRIWPLKRLDFFDRPLYDAKAAEASSRANVSFLALTLGVVPAVGAGVYPGRRGARRTPRARIAGRGVPPGRRRR